MMAWRRVGTVLGFGVPAAFIGTAAAYRWKSQVNIPTHELLDLKDRNIVLTGASSGIGRATTELLLRRGAHVIVGCRDAARGQALCDELQHLGDIKVVKLDLTDPQSVNQFATTLNNYQTSGVHAFVNCAAEIRCKLERTSTGVDVTFASNHLGPQQLLERLAPQLVKAATSDRHSRIVLVGSRLEKRGTVDVHHLAKKGTPDPAMMEKFDPMKNYAASKLANMLLANELHQRFAASNVDVFTVTPGMVHTDLWRNFPAWYRIITYPVRVAFLRSPHEAAQGIVYAVAAQEIEGAGGKYLSDGKTVEPSKDAQDKAKASALFDACNSLIVKTA